MGSLEDWMVMVEFVNVWKIKLVVSVLLLIEYVEEVFGLMECGV